MKSGVSRILAGAAVTLAMVMPAVAAPDPARTNVPAWAGMWRDTKNTVHIKAAPCGANMCATVVWATAQNKAKVAAQGGTLIGTQLLRGFHQTANAEWKGTVFVPDRGMTVSGTVTLVNYNTLKTEGCGLWGLICRSRNWLRIP